MLRCVEFPKWGTKTMWGVYPYRVMRCIPKHGMRRWGTRRGYCGESEKGAATRVFHQMFLPYSHVQAIFPRERVSSSKTAKELATSSTT